MIGKQPTNVGNGDRDVDHVEIVGAGLAGSEAALQLAQRGCHVTLYEMRPTTTSPAHHGTDAAELVCSNSLKSNVPTKAAGILKTELQILGSHLLKFAYEAQVPAGGALAVDRRAFSRRVTAELEAHPRINLVRKRIDHIPNGPCILAPGPLAHEHLIQDLQRRIGPNYLSFYDAAAPIVEADSLNMEAIFAQSRYEKEGQTSDYLNAPLTKEEYDLFYQELIQAKKVTLKEFERHELFSGCQPIEEVARTGYRSLLFGIMKPVGLRDPRTQRRPFAVVQLRKENLAGTAYNLVGFQTNLTFAAQNQVFSLIPGLSSAEFSRYGVMHRNTFVNAPKVLSSTLQLKDSTDLWLAGQITGTEGYTEAIASGLLASLNCYAHLKGLSPVILPPQSAFGSLIDYATLSCSGRYEPMHVNFGIMGAHLPKALTLKKNERGAYYAAEATSAIRKLVSQRSDIIGNHHV